MGALLLRRHGANAVMLMGSLDDLFFTAVTHALCQRLFVSSSPQCDGKLRQNLANDEDLTSGSTRNPDATGRI
jgi:hypothetical protein